MAKSMQHKMMVNAITFFTDYNELFIFDLENTDFDVVDSSLLFNVKTSENLH